MFSSDLCLALPPKRSEPPQGSGFFPVGLKIRCHGAWPHMHEFLLCTQQSHHFLQHGWYTHMKVDVTQCRGFLGKGLRNFLHRHRLCLPFVSTHRGNGRRETLRVGNKTVFSFPLSCLLLGPSLVKGKKYNNKTPAAPVFFTKCSRALVHLLVALNSRKCGALSL